jgi:proteasome lid subunit RPN8/RPN11
VRASKISIPQNILKRLELIQETSDIEECGVLIGKIEKGDNVTVTRLCATKNLLPSQVSFEIDPQELFNIFNQLDNEEDIVAIYHTHPTSPAKPSAWDREYMEHATFIWVIAGIDTINAFLWEEGKIKKIEIETT